MGYLQDRLSLIEVVPETFVGSVDALRGELLAELARLLIGISPGGEIDITRIEEIIQGMGNFLFAPESEYLLAAQGYVGGFSEIVGLANDNFKIGANKTLEAVLEAQRFRLATLFAKPAVEQAVGQGIRDLVTGYAAGGTPLDVAIDGLREFIIGSTNEGALTRYVKTWGMTAYANADRQYVKAVADDLGLDTWLYSGSIVKDSRDFCLARVGKTFTSEEVASWGGLQWQGRMAGTDESNIFERLGGWNCMHVLLPG